MVSDQEPRYRLVDSGGTVVGTLFAEADGTLKLQEGTSGSDNEVSVATDGTFSAPALSAGDLAIDETWHYAGDDSELDTAISNASAGDTILLGNTTYSDSRTISEKLTLKGTAVGSGGQGSEIGGEWILSDRIKLADIRINNIGGDTVIIDNQLCEMHRCSGFGESAIQVNADRFMFTAGSFCTVTFASGTSSGLIDSCVGTSVTDNGTNTVGDIA